jgi:hypothetical protein
MSAKNRERPDETTGYSNRNGGKPGPAGSKKTGRKSGRAAKGGRSGEILAPGGWRWTDRWVI